MSDAEELNPETPKRSIHDAARQEEERHKWIESEKARQDLGDRAVTDWVQIHWRGFLRNCWVEHLEGKQFWIELDRNDFGLLEHPPFEGDLFEPVIAKLKSGEENLNVICWAGQCGKLNEKLTRMLTKLDLNRCHIPHRIEQPPI